MSFRCSVFGHRYGDPEVEREREEDGSEVVITIRETETCDRCGDERVVSENKEVTTLETAADIVADDLGEDDDDRQPPDEEPSDPPADETAPEIPDAESGAEVIDAESEEANSTPPSSEPATPEPTPDASEDDGVILEDDTDENGDESERAPGEWPEEPEPDDDEWEPPTEPEPEPLDTEATVEATGNAVTVPEGEFHCPECGFTTPVEESSLRAGDFCPECHRGALEHLGE